MPGSCSAGRSHLPSPCCSFGAWSAVICSGVQLLLLVLQPDHTTTTALIAIPPNHVAYSSTTAAIRWYPCRLFRGDPPRQSTGGIMSPSFGTESACAHWKDKSRAAGAAGLQAALEVLPADRLEPGCVLWASPDNYGHSTFKSVALVYEHGEGRVTKAVAVDKGLEFTIGEMTNVGAGQLSNNRLFRGGEDGGSAVIMIHEHDTPGSKPLGDSGLFVGGFQAAMALVSSGEAQAKDFKFFFNYMTWSDGTVEEQVRKGQWKLLKLPNEVLLDDRRMKDMELWGQVERVMEKEWKE